jgi:hypothetical protein
MARRRSGTVSPRPRSERCPVLLLACLCAAATVLTYLALAEEVTCPADSAVGAEEEGTANVAFSGADGGAGTTPDT